MTLSPTMYAVEVPLLTYVVVMHAWFRSHHQIRQYKPSPRTSLHPSRDRCVSPDRPTFVAAVAIFVQLIVARERPEDLW